MTNKPNEWEQYLLSIGVKDISNDDEIAEKIEQANPNYQRQVQEAIDSIDEPFIVVDRDNIATWLESLGD